ncbi:MAG: tRNA (N(6)-L-threonylcarbamoyladenosine(37)-C(2))-methylthiotransferase [Thaumarchaeota archaeon]|nr:tRNA (N(6)-L-threonylcarbamoyladenosine(37)-C(2))-methylthiotransferase [Nitrososphaerota archaeon]
MKIYIETYGCTLNQADSDIMSGVAKGKGHEVVNTESESDVVVLNTCTVKGTTESRIRERIKKLQKQNKKFVVAGCMTANSELIRKIAPNAPILGTSSLSAIADAVQDAEDDRPQVYRLFESKDALNRIFTAPVLRIPINDGCTSSCNFCQTKLARPFLRSYSPKTVVKWIREGVAKGACEVQLTSMDSGAYGIDIKTNLGILLKSIVSMEEKFLLRLGMINPNHAKRLKTHIAAAMESEKIYKFIHIPVQAGSEKVCKDMNRDHTVKDFVGLVDYFRGNFPEILISTDIIVGYPTETEEDFQETCQMIKDTWPDIINISRFSPRPGTKAKKLKQIGSPELKRRSSVLNELVKNMQTEKNKKLIGQIYDVTITEKDKDFNGRNINYKQIVIKNTGKKEVKLGDKIKVEITDANYGSLFGKVIE